MFHIVLFSRLSSECDISFLWDTFAYSQNDKRLEMTVAYKYTLLYTAHHAILFVYAGSIYLQKTIRNKLYTCYK